MVTKLKIALIAGVSIVVIAGITVGIVLGTKSDDDEDTTKSCGKFDTPELTLAEVGGKLVASWSKPENAEKCLLTYKIKYTIDGSTEVSEDTKEIQYEFKDLQLDPCTEVIVHLIAINQDNEESAQATATYTKDVDDGFATVTDLEVTHTEGNNALITWIRPAGFDKCHMVYRITVDDHSTDIEELQHGITLEYCATTTVVVTPVIGEVVGVAKAEDVELEISEGFNSIAALHIEKVEKKVKVTWEELPGFEKCPIIYKVALGDGAETDDTEFDLVNGFCADYTIKVTPVIDGTTGTPVTDTKYIDVETDFDDVTDLKVIPTVGNEALVTWVAPVGFENCVMSYRVHVSGDFVETDGLSATVSLEYCKTNTITVTPFVGAINGSDNTHLHELDVSEKFAKVDDLDLAKNGEKLKVTWTQPDGFSACSFSYAVSLNDVAQDDVTSTEVEFDLSEEGFCIDYVVEVTPIVNEVKGETATKMQTIGVDVGFGAVTDLTIGPAVGNKVLVSWVAPLGFEKCTMSYRITVGDESEVIDGLSTTVSLEYCTISQVTVVPVIGDIQGTESSETHTLDVAEDFAKVTDLDLVKDGDKLKVTWTQPEGFSECSFKYAITLNDVDQDEQSSTVAEYDLSEGLCGNNKVAVTPIVNGVKGETAIVMKPIGVDDGFGAVTDLTITPATDKEVSVSWDAPSGFEKCTMRYTITVGDQTKTVDEPHTVISLEYCATSTVVVVPVVDGVHGLETTKTHVLAVPEGLAKVADLDLVKNGDKLKVTWTQPAGFSECSFSYAVVLNDVPQQDATSPEGDYDLFKGICADYNVEVTPIVDGVVGEKATETEWIGVDEGFGAVADVSMNPTSGNEVKISWVAPKGFEQCTITYKVTVAGQSKIVDDLSTTVYFEYCSTSLVSIVPVIDGVNGIQTGSPYALNVEEGFAKVADLALEKNGDKLKVTWTQPDGFSKCTFSYAVAVNGVDQQDETSPEGEYDLFEGVCTDYDVEVTPIVNRVKGEPATDSIPIGVDEGFAAVTDLEITPTVGNDALVSWVAPSGFEKCAMKYRVSVNGQLEIFEEVSATVYLEYCAQSLVTVTPVIDDIYGTSTGTSHALAVPEGLAKVTDLDLATNGDKLKVTWTRPDGFSKCAFSYAMVLNGVDQPDKTSTEAEYDLSEGFCFDYKVDVTPVVSQVKGQTATANEMIDPDSISQVEGLQVNIEEHLFVATWMKPSGFQSCSLKYDVELAQGGDIIALATVQEDETNWEYYVVESCPGDIEFKISAKYGTVSGETTSATATCTD